MASFEKLEGNQVKLTMSIPAADFEKAIDSAYLKLRKTIAIPGFRKGHAPKGVIDIVKEVEAQRRHGIRYR